MMKKISEPDFSLERSYAAEGFGGICGIDEAGRGPLAGPVCAAACILPETLELPGLNDSKKLTERRREQLYELLVKGADCAIAFATPEEIDSLNILGATMLAMRRALEGLHTRPSLALIDGNRATGFPEDIRTVTVVKGDSLSRSIAAASVLAKVTRDRLCMQLDEKHPEYSLAVHKGYPTAAHRELVRKLGPCEIYRASFLKKIMQPEDPGYARYLELKESRGL